MFDCREGHESQQLPDGHTKQLLSCKEALETSNLRLLTCKAALSCLDSQQERVEDIEVHLRVELEVCKEDLRQSEWALKKVQADHP